MVNNEKIVFTRSISRSGKNMVKIITIPKSIHPLVDYKKTYKIMLEEIEINDVKKNKQ